MALGAGVAHANHLLRPALAHLGRAARRLARSGRPALLRLQPHPLPAGRDLPHGHPHHLRDGAVFVHRRRGPPVVRLRLPANRLYRDLHVDGAPGRRRAQRPHETGRRPHVRPQTGPQARQTGPVDCLCAVVRHHPRGLLHAHPRAAGQPGARHARPLGNLLGLFLRLRHLRQRRAHARASLQIHVPLRALSKRHVRQRHPHRHLRRRPWRAARRTRQKSRLQGAGPGRMHQLHPVRASLPRGHRHPQRPAIRMHQLRRLHRRLRQRDGQDGLPARPHPLLHRKRRGQRLEPPAAAAPRAAPARAGLHRHPGRRHHRAARQHCAAHPVQSGHRARPRRARPHRGRRPHRKHLPRANHERRRSRPHLHPASPGPARPGSGRRTHRRSARRPGQMGLRASANAL